MIEKIQALKEQIEALSAANAEELEALRIKYLSKKGEITSLFNDFRNVPNEQKREIGQKLNELKTLATDKINAIREAFNANAVNDVDIDLTRTAAPQEIGTRHPISLVRKEIIDIFSRLGFTIAEAALWSTLSPLFASSARVVCIATRLSRLALTASSTRWKLSTSTKM